MSQTSEGRVAVYIDFDNIIISRYDQIRGRGRFHKDNVRGGTSGAASVGPDAMQEARVDIGAVLDFASSFGSIVISRAYADWSVSVNSGYRRQLMNRAVDLVQLFPAVASMKNGADIRLAVDVVEDLFRLTDLSHVVIVAGDSDYIPLAQRCKRLGRYVVGIGVAGSTSKALAAACDEFADYDALPGVEEGGEEAASAVQSESEREQVAAVPGSDVAGKSSGTGKAGKAKAGANAAVNAAESDRRPTKKERQEAQTAATGLLVRALRLGQAKDDVEWLPSSSVKSQMLRMDPSFQESALGHKTFTDFIKSRGSVVELQEEGQLRTLRLRPTKK